MKDGRAIARDLVDQLRNAYGSRLLCATLYGSVARGEAIPGVSDVNVMVLLDDIHPESLALAAPIAKRWIGAGHTPPLIMEREQWRRARDVFAIELADMRDAHEPLHGDDCVAGPPVSGSDLRAQAERELRGKLLQLQTGLLMGATDPVAVGGLLMKALPSFTTYLRAVLRLTAHDVPRSTPEVIKAGTQAVGASPEAFQRVWEARLNGKPLRLALTDPIVRQYHNAAEQTAVFVDHLREVGE
jgi:hypothetical protein